jgi:hypothetical protein
MASFVPWRAAVMALACATAVACVVAPALADNSVDYCNKLTPPHTACDAHAVGVAYNNDAQYLGSGSVSVCERGDSGNSNLSRRCAVSYVNDATELDAYYAAGILMYLQVGNNSASTHTIKGHSDGYNLSSYNSN